MPDDASNVLQIDMLIILASPFALKFESALLYIDVLQIDMLHIDVLGCWVNANKCKYYD